MELSASAASGETPKPDIRSRFTGSFIDQFTVARGSSGCLIGAVAPGTATAAVPDPAAKLCRASLDLNAWLEELSWIDRPVTGAAEALVTVPRTVTVVP